MPEAEDSGEPGAPGGVRLRRVRPRGADWRRRDLSPLYGGPGDDDAFFMRYRRFAGVRLSWREWRAFAMSDLGGDRLGLSGAATLSALAFVSPAFILSRPDAFEIGGAPLAILALLILATAAAVLTGWERQWRDRLDERGDLAIQATLWDWLAAAPGAALRALGAARTAQAAAAAAGEADRARVADTTLLAEAPLIGAGLLAAAALSAAFAGLIAAVALLHAAAQGAIGLATAAARRAAAGASADAGEAAAAMAAALPEARLDGSQGWHLARLEAAAGRERRHGAGIAAWETAGVVGAVGASLLTLVMLIAVAPEQGALGVLAPQLYLSALVLPAAGRCGAALAARLAAGLPAAATGVFAGIRRDDRPAGRACPPVARLSLVRAGLTYPGTDRPALAPTDFSIGRGEVVALTGASGAGKSTLLRLLMGLDRPDVGAVLVNGIDLRTLDLESFQTRIAAVGQNESCPVATIRAIVIGQARIPPRRAAEAIDRAHLGAMVASLPMGPQTLVTSANFPSALIGKLFVARALARSPDILLLDEALDAFTACEQADLMNDLRRARIGVIFVTHNPLSAALADRIVEIRNCPNS